MQHRLAISNPMDEFLCGSSIFHDGLCPLDVLVIETDKEWKSLSPSRCGIVPITESCELSLKGTPVLSNFIKGSTHEPYNPRWSTWSHLLRKCGAPSDIRCINEQDKWSS